MRAYSETSYMVIVSGRTYPHRVGECVAGKSGETRGEQEAGSHYLCGSPLLGKCCLKKYVIGSKLAFGALVITTRT